MDKIGHVKSTDDEMNAMLTYLADEDAKTNDPESLERLSHRILGKHGLMESILAPDLRRSYGLGRVYDDEDED